MGDKHWFWLPKDFKLLNERINSIVNQPHMQIVTKENLMGELMSEHFIEEHYREVARTQSIKFTEEMEREKEQLNEKKKSKKTQKKRRIK